HPPAGGQHVMLPGASFTDKLLANADGERHIKQPVAVNVSEFPLAHPKFASAKSVRPGFDTRPAEYRRLDLLRPSRHVISQASHDWSSCRLRQTSFETAAKYDARSRPGDLGWRMGAGR